MSINKIYIIDDNFMHRNSIKKAVVRVLDDINLKPEIEEIDNIAPFFQNISSDSILDTDLFFLDIDLNTYFSGIDIAVQLREYNTRCFIVFITSHKEKALEAIHRGCIPFGYITKDDFQVANIDLQVGDIIKKANTTIQAQFDDTLFIQNGAEVRSFMFSSILYFETVPNNRYSTMLWTIEGQDLLNGSISKFKDHFTENTDFCTIFKSFVINIKNIKKLSLIDNEITFLNNHTLYMGRKPLLKLKKYIQDYGEVL
ncbi:LytR/AlgR family response regulator transcription factor [Listeria newyorkensis]|uniref:Response regulator n=1 Tax=Listeria newyorkensis TaxID=1497681 RepID=A0A841YW93_9LIST|nr:LytTR family transcriptional regulator DNA-binding domain-containing protein [Listeria newyorkensis]MBC1457764.1 response regulator [Listeria newyorkensis]